MGCLSLNKTKNNKPRTIYIDLLSDNEPVIQPESFCGNKIKTTNYSVYVHKHI